MRKAGMVQVLLLSQRPMAVAEGIRNRFGIYRETDVKDIEAAKQAAYARMVGWIAVEPLTEYRIAVEGYPDENAAPGARR